MTTPCLAAASDLEVCGSLLAGLAEAAEIRGYDVSADAGELFAVDGEQNELHAVCDQQRARLELLAAEGASVDIEISPEAMTLAGSFPGFGRVSQDWTGDASMGGRARFAAVGAAVAASVEFDVGTDESIADGDPAATNAWFRPVLARTSIWADAHFLLFRMLSPGGLASVADENLLAAGFDLAVPEPDPRDVDKGSVKKDCGATALICSVAIFVRPATGACLGAAAKCFAAFKCWKDDCSGDGKA